MNIDDLLRMTVESGASDLLIRVGSPPLMRRHGQLEPLGEEALSAEEAQALSYVDISPEQQARFETDHELSFAYSLPGLARFRGQLYRQRGQTQSVFRVIPALIRPMEELRLPPVCKYFAERPHGLVLVSGPSGSGRSTTLAAMLDYINRHFALSVLTLEDPIEYVHDSHKALVTQRELDQDTHSFPHALQAALRQDMDVLLVSELHDAELIALALTAAETGHLVFAALHAGDAVQAIERVVEAFPPHQQPQIRMQLSVNLIGVLSQRLVPTRDGRGRVAAFEALVGVSTIRSLIREGKTHQIGPLIQTGSKQGMVTLDQSLAHLVKKGLVTYETALAYAHNRAEFDFLCTDSEPVHPTPLKPPTVRLGSPD